MGMHSATVDDAESLAAVLATSNAGPLLVDVRIDPARYPELIRITRG